MEGIKIIYVLIREAEERRKRRQQEIFKEVNWEFQ